MTFVKPSTITNQTGAYTYKSIFSSPTANYIDNHFASALDKTGDTITGIILVNGGGVFGGATLEFTNGGLLQIDNTGGMSLYGEMDVKSGGVINIDSGGELEVDAGATVSFGQNNVTWTNSAVPKVSQATTSSSPQNFIIEAQTTNGSHTGGSLVLSPGGGSSGVGGNNIYPMVNMCPYLFYGLSTVTGVLQVVSTSLVGGLTPNTQNLQNSITQAYASTTTSGGSDFFFLSMVNNTSAFVEITWMRRQNTGGAGGAFGNRGAFCITCNGAGTTVGEANPTVAYSGYDANTAITATYTSNLVAFSCANGSVNNLDWQFKIEIVYI